MKIYIYNKGEKHKNERKSWNGKQIKKLLFIVTIKDLERFTLKILPVIYTSTFLKLSK